MQIDAGQIDDRAWKILQTICLSVLDLHCHLDLYQPSDELLDRIRSAKFVFAVTTTPLALQGNKVRFGSLPAVKIGCGLHPEVVAARSSELPLLLEQIGDEDFVGEVGLDGGAANRASFLDQTKVFSAVVRRCGELGGKIVSIHSRSAVTHVLQVLEDNRSVGYPIFHWFLGSTSQALRVVRLGGYFSVNGAAVNSRIGRQWLSVVPRNLILPETDGPFHGNGERPLWPGETQGAIRALSEIWAISEEDAEAQVLQNFNEFAKKL